MSDIDVWSALGAGGGNKGGTKGERGFAHSIQREVFKNEYLAIRQSIRVEAPPMFQRSYCGGSLKS